MELAKDAWKNYFIHLKEKGLQELKTAADKKRNKINEKIEQTNQEIKLLEETVLQLKSDADQFSF